MQSLQVLKMFEATSVEREQFAIQVIEAIKEGEVDPLKVHAQLKSAEDLIARLTDEKGKSPEVAKTYRKYLLESAEQYGKKFEAINGKWEIKEVGTKYDYSKCNDPVLLELEAAAKKATDALKKRQTFLQAVPQKGIEVITEDGEAITIFPPSKSSTTAVTVTLK